MGLHQCKQLESLLIVCILLTEEMVSARKAWKTPDYCDDHQQSEDDEYVTSFLWSVKRNPPAYFFGTIHVPYTRVWDHIPDNGKRAFEISDNVFFELDLTDPYTISALTNCQLLPHGENLVDVIPKDIYIRLKRHLDYVKVMMPLWITSDQKGRGLYADYLFNAITGNWERKRPVWVMLMVNSLTESDIKSRGIPVLDLYLAQEAERLNKRTGAVEKVEEQCLPLNGLNLSQVVFALNQTLHQHESIRAGDMNSQYSTDDLIKHYNCGNLNAVIFNRDSAQVPNLTNVSLAPMEQLAAQKIDDYFREELIYRRNKRMGQRVADLLRAYPDQSFFFAFGAGHFLGNMSVLDFILQHGYEIEHLPPDKKLKGFGRRHRHRGIVPELKLLKDFTVPVTNLKIDPAISSLMEEKRKRLQPDSWTLYQSYQPALSWGAKSSHFFNDRNPKHGGRENPHVFPLDSKSTSTKKDRNFNDLWVRLESTASSPLLKRMDPDEAVQQSLRVWYGLPSSGESLYYQQTFLVPILVLCLILSHFGCAATISVNKQ